MERTRKNCFLLEEIMSGFPVINFHEVFNKY